MGHSRIMLSSLKTSKMPCASLQVGTSWLRIKSRHYTVIADKVARMLNGDPDYVDNWHDIIGYATLVETRLKSITT